MGRWISESSYERTRFEMFSLKRLTCYKPGRSKTLSERGCMGFHLPPKISKVGNRSSELQLLVWFGKTKEGPTTRQLQRVLDVGW